MILNNAKIHINKSNNVLKIKLIKVIFLGLHLVTHN